jgi:hypothetical protein
MRLDAAVGVGGPLLRQVQRPIEKGRPVPASLTGEDANPAVLDAAGRAIALVFYSERVRAFLQEPRLVHH